MPGSRPRGIRLFQISKDHAGGDGGVAIPGVLNVKTLRSVLGKIEVVEIRERISAIKIAAESGRRIASEKICRYACAAEVVVSVYMKIQLVAEDGRAGFVGVHVAVIDREKEVPVISFRAIGVNVVAGVDDEVRRRQRRLIWQRDLVGAIDQVSDAGFIVDHDGGTGIRYRWEEAFVANDREGELCPSLAGAEVRGEAAARHTRASHGILVDRVIFQVGQDSRVVCVRSVRSWNGRKRRIGCKIVIDNASAGRDRAAVVPVLFRLSDFNFVSGSVGCALIGLPGDHHLVRKAKSSAIAELDIRSKCDLLGEGRGRQRDTGGRGQNAEPRAQAHNRGRFHEDLL